MPAQMDIYIQRNEDYSRAFTLIDGNGAVIDITGCVIAMQVKTRTDNSMIIDSADIEIIDAANGIFEATLRASEGYPLSTFGSDIQTENLRYDIRLTYPDGIKLALVCGCVILSRGTTQP